MKFHSRFILITIFLRSCLAHFNGACSDSVYMKIPYSGKLVNHYVNVTMEETASKCLERCRNHRTCKSVAMCTGNSVTKCFLYEGRLYAGQSAEVQNDVVYYWLLEAECPIHLGYHEDMDTFMCTKYNATHVQWDEARRQCEEDGGHLFMATSEIKVNKIPATYAQGIGRLTYLGATDVNEEGVWNWFNGDAISALPFSPDNLHGIQHCIALEVDDVILTLRDKKCEDEYGFICEIPTQSAYRHQ